MKDDIGNGVEKGAAIIYLHGCRVIRIDIVGGKEQVLIPVIIHINGSHPLDFNIVNHEPGHRVNRVAAKEYIDLRIPAVTHQKVSIAIIILITKRQDVLPTVGKIKTGLLEYQGIELRTGDSTKKTEKDDCGFFHKSPLTLFI
jgi:hypothetical protein